MKYCRLFIIIPECFAGLDALSLKFLNPYIISNLNERFIQAHGLLFVLSSSG